MSRGVKPKVSPLHALAAQVGAPSVSNDLAQVAVGIARKVGAQVGLTLDIKPTRGGKTLDVYVRDNSTWLWSALDIPSTPEALQEAIENALDSRMRINEARMWLAA